jgi:hypothetical protein
MTCGFTKYELYIIWRICYRNRWCNKHIGKRDLVKGRPKHEIDIYLEAVDSLVKKGFLQEYHSQGRSDVCIPKQHRNKALEALKLHQNEYSFISNIEFIR